MVCSSLAEAHDEHSVAGPGPSETGDFNRLADHLRAKGADDVFFNHGETKRRVSLLRRNNRRSPRQLTHPTALYRSA